MRGLAAALTGRLVPGWLGRAVGGNGRARARRARPPPSFPPRRRCRRPPRLGDSPGLSRVAAGGQGVTFRCPPSPVKAAEGGSLPSSRPEVAVAGTARKPFRAATSCKPRAVPTGNMWRRGEESRACAAPDGSACRGGGGGRSVAVLLAAGGARRRRPPLCTKPPPAQAAAPGSGWPCSQGELRRWFFYGAAPRRLRDAKARKNPAR